MEIPQQVLTITRRKICCDTWLVFMFLTCIFLSILLESVGLKWDASQTFIKPWSVFPYNLTWPGLSSCFNAI